MSRLIVMDLLAGAEQMRDAIRDRVWNTGRLLVPEPLQRTALNVSGFMGKMFEFTTASKEAEEHKSMKTINEYRARRVDTETDVLRVSTRDGIIAERIFHCADTTASLTELMKSEMVLHPEIQPKVQQDLHAAERLFSTSELVEVTGEQMTVKWSVAVTENQQLDVEVRLTPSIILRSDVHGNTEVIVVVDYLRSKVVRSERTDSSPDHFIQSLKIVVCPTGKWSESFCEGFGLINCSPGNEMDPPLVQKASSCGCVVGFTLSAFPSAVLQLTKNKTSGTTFPAYGFEKSKRDGNAYVCKYELRTFEDGSSARDLRRKLFRTIPEIPKAVRGDISYPNLSEIATFAGTWMVPCAAAMELRNGLYFNIALEAKLPAVRKCKIFSLARLSKPPKHELFKVKVETRQLCVFK